MIKTHTRIKSCHNSCQSLRRHPTEIIYFISTKFLPPYSYLLNDLEVLSADVQNASINARTEEKVYTTAGSEFGTNEGRPAIKVHALYGLKSSGARWRDHLAAILIQAGFRTSKAGPDVWMCKAHKSSGFTYWEYVLCYVDDILAISFLILAFHSGDIVARYPNFFRL